MLTTPDGILASHAARHAQVVRMHRVSVSATHLPMAPPKPPDFRRSSFGGVDGAIGGASAKGDFAARAGLPYGPSSPTLPMPVLLLPKLPMPVLLPRLPMPVLLPLLALPRLLGLPAQSTSSIESVTTHA